MGRSLFVASAIASALLLLSCQKAKTTGLPPAEIADAKSCLVLAPELTFWDLSGSALTQKGTVQIGEKLVLLGQTRHATLNGKERDLLKVRRDTAKEGWVRADSVLSNAILAVAIVDAVIYSVPRNTAATTASIPRMTVLGIHSDSAGMPFVQVSAFDPQQRVLLSDVYLRNEGLSARPDDVQAAILLQLAAASKSQKQQEAFIETGIKDYPESVFLPQLKEALDALRAPPRPQPQPEQQPASSGDGSTSP
ncbi:MAG TPA: hypothetical protein VL354_17990 [Spirochaetia bacterium]|nr:hypothetical protein [Spirochaetia bacterium]